MTYFGDDCFTSCCVGALGGVAGCCDSRFKDLTPFCTASTSGVDVESLFLGSVSGPSHDIAKVSCDLQVFGRAIAFDHRGIGTSDLQAIDHGIHVWFQPSVPIVEACQRSMTAQPVYFGRYLGFGGV